jgi:Domain of unknown function (DUF3846)
MSDSDVISIPLKVKPFQARLSRTAREGKMRAIWINADKREITTIEYDGLADLQRMVGGFIEVAWHNRHGDVMYVDEEGKLKNYSSCFIVHGVHDVLFGNGVVVGKETDEFTDGGFSVTLDPVVTITDLKSLVMFGGVGRPQA